MLEETTVLELRAITSLNAHSRVDLSRDNLSNHDASDFAAGLPASDDRPTSLNESSLPPVDGGWGAWSYLAAAFAVETVAWGFPDVYGTYLEVYLKDPRYTADSQAEFILPLIGVLTRGIMSCASVFLIPLAGKYPRWRKWSVWIAVPICWASLFGASYAQTTNQLLALQGIVYAIGGALLYAPAISLTQEWFFEKRGLAQAVIQSGTAFGGLVLPLVMSPIITSVGVSKALRYQSIFLTAIMLPVLWFFKPRIPPSSSVVVNESAPRGEGEARKSLWPLWRDAGFVSFVLVNILHSLAYFLPLVWLPTFGAEMGLNSNQASISLAVLNATSMIGRLSFGYLSDKHDPALLAMLGLVVSSVSSFVLWGVLSYNLGGLIAFGALYGCFAGGYSALWTRYINKYINKHDNQLSSLLFGYLAMIRGVGGLVSTPISSALNKATGLDGSGYVATTGYNVAGGKFENMIIYVGSVFAGAAGVAVLGWGNDLFKKFRIERRSARGD